MKRILLGIGALFVLAAPAVVGMLVETRYQALVARISALGFEIVSNDFQQGWFHSTAKTEFQLGRRTDAAPMVAAERFTLNSRIAHGPLPFDELALAEIVTVSPGLEGALLGATDRSLRTLIFLDGGGRTEIEWPAIDGQAVDSSTRMTFGAVSGLIEFTAMADEVRMRVETQGGSISEHGRDLLELGPLRFDARTYPGSSGVTLGRGNLHFDRLMVRDRESPASIRIEGLDAAGESREVSQLIDAEVSYRLKGLEVGRGRYGPGVVQLEVKRLSARALGTMQREIERIAREQMTETEIDMALLGVMSRAAGELLRLDPIIALKRLQIDTPDGQLSVDFSLQSQGLSLLDLVSMPALLAKLSGALSVRIPEPLLRTLLVQQSRQQLERQSAELEERSQGIDPVQLHQQIETRTEQRIALWLRQGFVVREDGLLTATASLSSGLLSVNGKTIPLLMRP